MSTDKFELEAELQVASEKAQIARIQAQEYELKHAYDRESTITEEDTLPLSSSSITPLISSSTGLCSSTTSYASTTSYSHKFFSSQQPPLSTYTTGEADEDDEDLCIGPRSEKFFPINSSINPEYFPLLLGNMFKIVRLKPAGQLWIIRHCEAFLKIANKREKEQPYDKSLIELIAKFIFSTIHWNHAWFLEKLCKNKFFLEHINKLDYTKYVKSFELDPQNIFEYAISRNAAETLQILSKAGWHTTTAHITIAIHSHAERSLDYLLRHIKLSPDKLMKFAIEAKKISNIDIIHKFLPDKPLFYFADILKKLENNLPLDKGEIAKLIYSALRKSSMHSVDNICLAFMQHLNTYFDDKPELLLTIRQEMLHERELFLKVNSQLARYRHPNEVKQLKDNYCTNNSEATEKEFGLSKFRVIERICAERFKPKINDLSLPICGSPPKNFMSMRDVFHILIESNNGADRTSTFAGKIYEQHAKTIRQDSSRSTTPCNLIANYGHAYHFIEVVANSYCEDLTHIKQKDSYLEPMHKDKEEAAYIGYSLTYKGHMLTYVDINPPHFNNCDLGWTWNHGLASLTKFWPEVERLHKTICEIDATDIQKEPQHFYDNVIEMIWLIGNLTPTYRGTGCYVEQVLAMTHRYHNLTPLVLKHGLQLDCLNLTFPLSMYKKIFLHFFEFNSLAPNVQKHLKQQYDSDPAIRLLLLQLKLDPPTLPIFDITSFPPIADIPAPSKTCASMTCAIL